MAARAAVVVAMKEVAVAREAVEVEMVAVTAVVVVAMKEVVVAREAVEVEMV